MYDGDRNRLEKEKLKKERINKTLGDI